MDYVKAKAIKLLEENSKSLSPLGGQCFLSLCTVEVLKQKEKNR